MTPNTKNLLKTLAAFGGTAIIFTLICAFGGYYAVKAARGDKANTVTPVAAEMDNTVEEHLKLDEEYHAACEDTKRILEECNKVLGECLDTLEHHAVILPTGEEKP